MAMAASRSDGPTDVAARYDRDGFYCPIDVLPPDEAQAVRADLEAAEAELADDAERLGLLRAYPDRLLPSFDALIRNDNLIAAASAVLGPDLIVWSASMFIKEAHSPKIVSWHQDLTYWGLDDAQEATCWVALSPASEAAGCMHFVPGSHKKRLVPHVDTFDENNLLTRGQEIAVEVREEDGVAAALETGQASMHHGHVFHASGPNTTGDRRLGSAIRYITPAMRQKTDDKPLVALVAGKDRHGHFTIAEPPKGRLLDQDFERCKADAAMRRRILYQGAEDAAGTRY